jgi:hypothetical protein
MTDLPQGLVDYLGTRRQQRADRANTAFALLRPYERRIVREAAVMGYVLGRRAGQIDGRNGVSILDTPTDFPGDFDIVRNVLQHCDSTDDKFPYLADACAGRRRRVTRKRMWPGEAAAIDHITTEENVL